VELTAQPREVMAQGKGFASNVSVLLGTNADEGSQFIDLAYDASEQDYEEYLVQVLGADLAALTLAAVSLRGLQRHSRREGARARRVLGLRARRRGRLLLLPRPPDRARLLSLFCHRHRCGSSSSSSGGGGGGGRNNTWCGGGGGDQQHRG